MLFKDPKQCSSGPSLQMFSSSSSFSSWKYAHIGIVVIRFAHNQPLLSRYPYTDVHVCVYSTINASHHTCSSVIDQIGNVRVEHINNVSQCYYFFERLLGNDPAPSRFMEVRRAAWQHWRRIVEQVPLPGTFVEIARRYDNEMRRYALSPNSARRRPFNIVCVLTGSRLRVYRMETYVFADPTRSDLLEQRTRQDTYK